MSRARRRVFAMRCRRRRRAYSKPKKIYVVQAKKRRRGKSQRRNKRRCGVYWFTEGNTGEHDHTLTHRGPEDVDVETETVYLLL